MGGARIQNEDKKMSLGKKELPFPEKESQQKKKKRNMNGERQGNI